MQDLVTSGATKLLASECPLACLIIDNYEAFLKLLPGYQVFHCTRRYPPSQSFAFVSTGLPKISMLLGCPQIEVLCSSSSSMFMLLLTHPKLH
jgi:hypothetical protein